MLVVQTREWSNHDLMESQKRQKRCLLISFHYLLQNYPSLLISWSRVAGKQCFLWSKIFVGAKRSVAFLVFRKAWKVVGTTKSLSHNRKYCCLRKTGMKRPFVAITNKEWKQDPVFPRKVEKKLKVLSEPIRKHRLNSTALATDTKAKQTKT